MAFCSFAALAVGLIREVPLIERGILRFMYGKDEVVMVLITYALFLILEDVIKLTGRRSVLYRRALRAARQLRYRAASPIPSTT